MSQPNRPNLLLIMADQLSGPVLPLNSKGPVKAHH